MIGSLMMCVSSPIVVAATALFAVIVFRTSRA
jgi:hypothetical protein